MAWLTTVPSNHGDKDVLPSPAPSPNGRSYTVQTLATILISHLSFPALAFFAVSNFSLSQHRVFRSVAINSSDCDVHLDRIHLSLSRWHVTPRNWTFFERLIRNVDIYFVSNSKEQQLKPKFYQSSDIFGDKEKENIGFALLYNLFQYILV